ncbi:hypothetical protein UFOVP589_40 [uncultured Caudovirales phage]|uniref:Uncharacterized protein n=1 Tax=uncultured Caudovirales phage TaxID=2100421 RepID=A0A6J5N7Z5_9CAUD|nr:hypothetical protein UFOVP589_40 [uncultured Caudovirales phage]
MTDEELIARLRGKRQKGNRFDSLEYEAADRIEALVKAGDMARSGYTRLLNEKLRGEWRDEIETKLAKAVDVITCILATAYADDHTGWHNALDDARTLLKELEAKP